VEYAATMDPDYDMLYLPDNCIDWTSEEEDEFGGILDYWDSNLGGNR
jgi:hypothetical protein